MAENDSLQRAENLWFSPDVVILRADRRVFRVFAAILKAQSSVFADMFAFPQPASADGTEMMDGFPVVKLHDDPDQVEVFLKAIFDSSFFMPPPAQNDFLDIVGILRLSHKYNVPYLRRRALEHLGAIYPTRLSEYDLREDNDENTAQTFIYRLVTIGMATEVGALWLLPVAYHDMCKNDIGSIISNKLWQALGEKERHAIVTGHSAQIQYFPKIVRFRTIYKEDGDQCDDHSECNRLRFILTDEQSVWRSMMWTLDAWPDRRWGWMEGLGICKSCVADAKILHAQARQGFWDQMPQMFGLPGWDELEEMRRVALSDA
ncbi:hypothetical protein B0H11DRAFT_1846688 [Mycena galericulata]|nr:hypothetical protein B0H11DRAFT_1846688 [Mycena galericulata]